MGRNMPGGISPQQRFNIENHIACRNAITQKGEVALVEKELILR